MLRAWFKRHFIPHEGNDYKPHILQETAVVGMMCLIIISFAVSNLHSFLWLASDWMVSTILPAVIISDTNDERSRLNLTPLVHSEVLDQAAQLKADDMARGSYFSHYSPTGLSPWYWFKQADYDYVHAGENLAVHFTDSGEVVDAWMSSPSHRANIVDTKFREIGIGTAKGTYEGYDTVFVVQLFGTKAAASPVVEVGSVPAPATTTNAALATVSDPVSENGVPAVVSQPVVAGIEDTEADNALAPATTTPTSTVPISDTVDSTKTATETVDVTSDGTVVVSSYLSTTTGGVPATIDESSGNIKSPTMAIATQPHKVLQIVYILIGLFVAVSLLLSIVIEFRLQQPLQVAYGIGLLALMMVMFYVHISISGGVLIV